MRSAPSTNPSQSSSDHIPSSTSILPPASQANGSVAQSPIKPPILTDSEPTSSPVTSKPSAAQTPPQSQPTQLQQPSNSQAIRKPGHPVSSNLSFSLTPAGSSQKPTNVASISSPTLGVDALLDQAIEKALGPSSSPNNSNQSPRPPSPSPIIVSESGPRLTADAQSPSLTWTAMDNGSLIPHGNLPSYPPLPSIRFEHDRKYNVPAVHVSAALLLAAGGPLAHFTHKCLVEKHRHPTVYLSPYVDPRTFAFITTYLHGAPLNFQEESLDRLTHLARAAKRWQLTPLFTGVTVTIAQRGKRLGMDAEKCRQSMDVFAQNGVTASAKAWFWENLGHKFSAFAGNRDPKSPPAGWGAKLCPNMPQVWRIAHFAGTLGVLIRGIQRARGPLTGGDLVDVIMTEIEPVEKNDTKIMRLLNTILGAMPDSSTALDRTSLRGATSRAVRLLAKAIVAEPGRHEMAYSLPVSLGSRNVVRDMVGFGCSGKDMMKAVLQVDVKPGSGVAVNVSWGVIGPTFKERRARLYLKMVDDGCVCGSRAGLSLMARGAEKVLGSGGEWQTHLDEKDVKEYRGLHANDGQLCIVTLSLRIKMMDAP